MGLQGRDKGQKRNKGMRDCDLWRNISSINRIRGQAERSLIPSLTNNDARSKESPRTKDPIFQDSRTTFCCGLTQPLENLREYEKGSHSGEAFVSLSKS